MPTYDFQCEACDEVFEELLSIAKMDYPLSEECPSCKKFDTVIRICQSPIIGDPVRLGLTKPPSDFREVLRKIQNNNPAHSFVKDR